MLCILSFWLCYLRHWGLNPASKHSLLPVALPEGKIVRYDELYIDCPIQIDSHESLTDLYKFRLTDFNVILGMDWLSK